MPAEHVRETLRRTFIYKFMGPDDIASAPVSFPGIKYEDGRLANGMKAEAAAHLIEALRGQGYELLFPDPAADVLQAMQHILWDRWTPAESASTSSSASSSMTTAGSTTAVRPSPPPPTPCRGSQRSAARYAPCTGPDHKCRSAG
jgi:hypothetical protein